MYIHTYVHMYMHVRICADESARYLRLLQIAMRKPILNHPTMYTRYVYTHSCTQWMFRGNKGTFPKILHLSDVSIKA